jgi:5'-nucleotidase
MVINRNGTVRSVAATNVAVNTTNANITPDASIKSIVDGYKTLVTPLANRPIGTITAILSNTANSAGENVMGDVIADSQLAATKAANLGGAVVAFMNPGGVRGSLSYTSSPAGEGDGVVTYSEAFAVQPFGNSLVTLTVTGAQIEQMLEQQFQGCPNAQPFNRILLPSSGFTYTWKASGPACDKVDPASIMINNVVVDPAASYRITVNNFLATGGDNFSVLTQGTNQLGGAQDIDALEAYLTANAPVAPATLNRIQLVP